MSDALELELKQLIIDTLGLEDISTDDIETDAPLFVDGLGLDSVDALELGLAIQKKYNFQMDNQNQDLRKNFYSVATLADYIRSR
ncbi:acyl carrier protein [Cricetibacter osteomyelitidis]|uniref:Acyl carrier protein n=1 Tax=Cricetibacter osteomyelitidis TaxID=1521931 RepID=A0A4V2T1U3_9PAST|nr:phosphopantetheine-binding protein [Cricetibacter osteomyelitidis]TCP94893.1 acyl carrier protein [Cricetibacter osteomyelitidis]